MKEKKEINQKNKELVTLYKSAPKQQGIGADFDFEEAFAKGLTVEEARKFSKGKIRDWWEK